MKKLFLIIAFVLIPSICLGTTRALQFDILLTPIIDYNTFAVASGYTVYFYAAGTSTAKNVWTEKEKTNAYTSRTIGSDGTVQVYGDGVYKLIIKDTDGTTVYEWDNVKCQANTFTVQTKADTYTATADDDVILVNTTTGAKTINLSTVANFTHPIAIKLIAGSNNVTIEDYSSELFDASNTSLTLTPEVDNAILYPDTNASTWRRLNRLTGLTATPAEINTACDGITATAAELNQLDGVTVDGSASGDIPTQYGDASFENLTVNTAFSGAAFLDEDNMASDASASVASQQSIKAYFDFLNPGFISRSIFEYSDDDQIKINSGTYMVDGKLCRWDSQLTSKTLDADLGGAPAASTWYYLYLDNSSITSGTILTNTNFLWDASPPDYSPEVHGWYFVSDRCIFAVYSDASQNIERFYHDGGEYIQFDAQQVDRTLADLDTSFVNVTLTIPNFGDNTQAMCLFEGLFDTDGGNRIYYRKDGSSAATNIVGRVAVGGTTSVAAVRVVTSNTGQTSQVIEVAMQSAGASQTGVNTIGWFLPRGM